MGEVGRRRRRGGVQKIFGGGKKLDFEPFVLNVSKQNGVKTIV